MRFETLNGIQHVRAVVSLEKSMVETISTRILVSVCPNSILASRTLAEIESPATLLERVMRNSPWAV